MSPAGCKNVCMPARQVLCRASFDESSFRKSFDSCVLLIVIVLLVTLEEISQLWFRTRTFSFGDLSASYFGVCCGLTLTRFARLALQRRLASKSVAHESPSTLA